MTRKAFLIYFTSFIAVGLLNMLMSQPTHSFEPITGIPTVIDGDSLEIHGIRLRLFGIDAVESAQICRRNNAPWLCGKEAAFALADKIKNAPVTCIGTKKDAYKRFLVTCYKNQEDLNRWMVREGWALAYKNYSSLYSDAEIEARRYHKGLWSGEFENPWEWRKDKRVREKKWKFGY